MSDQAQNGVKVTELYPDAEQRVLDGNSPCLAQDHPVWADGSQDHVRCELTPGHDSYHVGHFADGQEWIF